MLTSAASSTSAIVAGVSIGSVLVVVLLFATLTFREYAFLAEGDSEKYSRAFGAAAGTLAVAFIVNIAVRTVSLV